MVVRRSVALGLPVILVGTDTGENVDSVTNDYRKLATELAQHEPAT
jgi:DNA-binding LacI/PurR family transcriptional regulator